MTCDWPVQRSKNYLWFDSQIWKKSIARSRKRPVKTTCENYLWMTCPTSQKIQENPEKSDFVTSRYGEYHGIPRTYLWQNPIFLDFPGFFEMLDRSFTGNSHRSFSQVVFWTVLWTSFRFGSQITGNFWISAQVSHRSFPQVVFWAVVWVSFRFGGHFTDFPDFPNFPPIFSNFPKIGKCHK